MRIKLVDIDGKFPNLALMKLSRWHKNQGHEVVFSRQTGKEIWDYYPELDIVYASSLFDFSSKKIDELRGYYPNIIIGGTGTRDFSVTVENIVGNHKGYDYSIYPDYKYSLGFTQRGCRLNCKFCVVPAKEGRIQSVNSIYDIWRPETERKIILLDNDFFGQDLWLERVKEVIDGDFKISLNQGINIRLITEEQAHWLSKLKCYDHKFKNRRVYVSWDNLKDEKVFFRGVDRLEDANIPTAHIMVYMLVGFNSLETHEERMYRFEKIAEKGMKPYPMVYDNSNKELRRWARWIIGRYCQFISWDNFMKKEKFVKIERKIDQPKIFNYDS